MSSERHFDIAVVGAGLIGLATARALLRRRPGARVVVLEKESEIAAHQSGHNSGVIHSGIYYQPGTLKARLCVQGAALLHDFCEQRGIAHPRCGKLIVAVRPSELSRLENLKRRGDANGVQGLRLLDPPGIAEVEPSATGLRAIHSPQTAIVDYRAVARALADEIVASGGAVLTGWPVTSLRRTDDRWLIASPLGSLHSPTVVTCAGLHSDRLAVMTGASPQPRIVPFRGEYWRLHPRVASVVKGLIYPVPDPAFPFLGVHFTPRINGELWVGPNALLAFAREGYRRGQRRPSDVLQLLRWPGFYRLIARYWQMGLRETALAVNRRAFVAELQRYVPSLRPVDLVPSATGVRAQAVSDDGRLLDDFVFAEEDGILHVRNAPSPAATACLAIAETVVDRLEGQAILPESLPGTEL